MMTLLATVAETSERTPVGFWVATPFLVLLVVVIIVSPIWPYSRDWGWTIAGIFGITLGTIAMFTAGWLVS